MSRVGIRGRAKGGGISPSFAALIGSAAFLLGLLAGDALSHDRGVRAVRAPAKVVSELPPEWAWERPPVTFDHMFRKKE